MKKNAVNALNVITNDVKNLSGNLAGGTLPANVLYVN